MSFQEQHAIAGRCRRIGWDVEASGDNGDRRQTKWLYLITRPDGVQVQIHRTPSSVNWQHGVLRRLNGPDKLFDAAEEKANIKDEKARQARLAADTAKGKAMLAQAAKKAAAETSALQRAAGPHAVVEIDADWLLAPHQFFEAKLGIVTPELASKVLAVANDRNFRHFRPARQRFFVDVIKAGDWGATHQGGAMDVDGKLQDGQHRFGAIEETGQAQEMVMCVGMPAKMATKLDTPLMRTARDTLSARGETHVTTLNSAAALIMRFDRFGAELVIKKSAAKLTIDAIDRFVIEAGDDLRDAVYRCHQIRKEIKIVGSALAASIYLIGRAVGHNDSRVVEFFERIETGENIARNRDPEYFLRRHFINNVGTGRPSQYLALALIIKCWNARISKQPMRQLMWRTTEWFPATIIVPAPED